VRSTPTRRPYSIGAATPRHRSHPGATVDVCPLTKAQRLGGQPTALDIAVISTGAMSLDAALGVGGILQGQVTEIFGPEASGKTTIALHLIAGVQKTGGIAAFIDAEHALDPIYAQKLGEDRRAPHLAAGHGRAGVGDCRDPSAERRHHYNCD
jgi:RecA/RadA recombinase